MTLIESDGEVHTISEWERITGLTRATLYYRHKVGIGFREPRKCPTNKRKPLNPSKVFLTVDGKRRAVTTWSKKTGVPVDEMMRRLAIGWKDEDIVNVPFGTEDVA